MWIRVICVLVAAVAYVGLGAVSEDARRESDTQRRAALAAERLHGAIHEFAAVDLRADAGIHHTLLAGDMAAAHRRRRAAAAELVELRPHDADVRAAIGVARGVERAGGRRLMLLARVTRKRRSGTTRP